MYKKKVIVLAIDGGTFDLVLPWIEKGHLPNIKRILSEGTYGRLNSTIPALTAPAWTAFMTGRLPGNSGVFDFFDIEPVTHDLKCVTARTIKSEKIWNRLNRFGKKAVVLFVPLTYPVDTVDGLMISGLMTPSYNDEKAVCPKKALEKYKIDTALLSRNVEVIKTAGGKYDKFFQINLSQLKEKGRIALKALKEEDWDFFMLHLFEADTICHAMWAFKDAVLRIYEECDRIVGEVLDNIDSNINLILMSDHGFTGTSKRVNINKWLEEKGLLKFYDLNFDHIALNISRKLKSGANLRIGRELAFRMLRLFRSAYKAFPGSIRKIIDSFTMKVIGILPERTKKSFYPSHFSLIDWSKTKAYNFGPSGGIFVNLEGKCREGIVKEREYDSLLSFISRGLEGLRDDSGFQPITKVYRKTEIYQGECLDKMPDLIPRNSNACHFVFDFNDRKVISDAYSYVSGNHHREGIFAIKGPGIKKGKNIENVLGIADIAPTIYHLMDIPVPNQIDGKIVKACFEKDHDQIHI